MNTSLAPERSLDRDEQHIHARTVTPRPSAVDRLSLRLGLWLLLRGTRHLRRQHDRDAHDRARAAARARAARDTVSVHHLMRGFRA